MNKTNCGLCGKLFNERDKITTLPAISDVSNDLYVYFDKAFHTRCFENWADRDEIMETLKKEKESFHQSPYYTAMFKKYGKPRK